MTTLAVQQWIEITQGLLNALAIDPTTDKKFLEGLQSRLDAVKAEAATPAVSTVSETPETGPKIAVEYHAGYVMGTLPENIIIEDSLQDAVGDAIDAADEYCIDWGGFKLEDAEGPDMEALASGLNHGLTHVFPIMVGREVVSHIVIRPATQDDLDNWGEE